MCVLKRIEDLFKCNDQKIIEYSYAIIKGCLLKDNPLLIYTIYKGLIPKVSQPFELELPIHQTPPALHSLALQPFL